MALTDDEFIPRANDLRTRTCKHCSKPIKGDRSHRRRHLEKCKEYKVREQMMMLVDAILGASPSLGAESDAGGQPSNLEQQRITKEEKLVASMIVFDGCDPSILGSEGFIKSIWPNSSEVPSRTRIEEVCDIIFDEAKRVTAEILRKQVQSEEEGQSKRPGARVSLAVGKAKTLDKEVLYTACHFIDQDWKLHKVVLGAYVLVSDLPHHGPLSDVTEVYSTGESNQMIGEPLFDTSLPGVDLHSRLFMMAWGVLPSQGMKKLEHHSNSMKNQLAKVFHGTFPVEMELVSTLFIDQVLETVARCLQFVFLGFKRIIHQELKDLHLTRQVRQELHKELGLEGLSTYDKNWYRTYCALRILQIKKPALIDEDPELAKLLIDVFGVIYGAIKAISDPSCPTSNLCLPVLLKVREVLRLELARSDGGNSNICNISADATPKPENITKCLRHAKGTLDTAIEESYPLWSIPLVLDPRYKFRHIRDTLLPNEYGPEQAAKMSSTVLSKLNGLYTTYGGGGAVSMGIGSTGPSEQPMTEIDTYLQDNPVSFPREECCEILNWWKENSGKYPTMAQMARDTLPMPTCSRISSKQVAHITSIIRGYSKNTLEPVHFRAAAQEDQDTAYSLWPAVHNIFRGNRDTWAVYLGAEFGCTC